ncbi:MAG TPA: glycosyltransferase [Bacilli bacterium]|nr:glycosyltransferase [Bacilli bacterium]
MKKILFVFNHPAPYKVALYNGLSSFFDIHVIFERLQAKNRPSLFYHEKRYAFKLHKINGISLGKENFFSWGIRSELKKNKYDLVIINGYSTLAEMIGLHFLKARRIPYLFAINGGIVKDESKLKFWFKKKMLQGAYRYLSPSTIADEYLSRYGIAKEIICHYPYATITADEILPSLLSREEKRAFWEKNKIFHSHIFVSFGQFIARKNNVHLLNLWSKANSDCALVLIGEGPERRKYQSIIKKRHLRNVYIFPFMSHTDLLKFICHADGAIFLSREDIYGHMINEALSQGLPVIASSKIISARSLIKEGKNGFLVDPDNDEAIIAHIDSLNTDMSLSALATAKKNTIEKMVSAHKAIIEDLGL